MDEQSGTYVVTNADEGAAELQDPATGQVFALEDNPGLSAGEVVEATIEPVPPMEVAYRVVDVDDRRAIEVGESREAPTRQAQTTGADQPVGELTRIERAGEGELHVITVPAGETADAVADVLDDESGLVTRAARLGVNRVEVRAADEVAIDEAGGTETAGDDDSVGVVSVRYLP